MKKQNLNRIRLNKNVISTLTGNTILGGLEKPVEGGSRISYCHVGSRIQCCA